MAYALEDRMGSETPEYSLMNTTRKLKGMNHATKFDLENKEDWYV